MRISLETDLILHTQSFEPTPKKDPNKLNIQMKKNLDFIHRKLVELKHKLGNPNDAKKLELETNERYEIIQLIEQTRQYVNVSKDKVTLHLLSTDFLDFNDDIKLSYITIILNCLYPSQIHSTNLNKEEIEEKISEIEERLKDVPEGNISSWLNLGKSALNEELTEEEESKLKELLNHPVYDGLIKSKLNLLLGRVYEKKGLNIEAIQYYEQSIDNSGKEILAYLSLGSVLLRLNNFRQSIDTFSKAIELYEDPANFNVFAYEPYSNLGEVYIMLNEYEKAKICYRKAMALNLFSAQSYYNFGSLWEKIGNYVGAISLYQIAVEINPEEPWYFYSLATVYLKQGKKSLAEDNFRKAISFKVDEVNLCNGIGYSCMEKSEYELAFEYFDRGLRLDEEHSTLNINKGILKYLLNRKDDAKSLFEAVYQTIEPNTLFNKLERITCLVALDNYSQAIDELLHIKLSDFVPSTLELFYNDFQLLASGLNPPLGIENFIVELERIKMEVSNEFQFPLPDFREDNLLESSTVMNENLDLQLHPIIDDVLAGVRKQTDPNDKTLIIEEFVITDEYSILLRELLREIGDPQERREAMLSIMSFAMMVVKKGWLENGLKILELGSVFESEFFTLISFAAKNINIQYYNGNKTKIIDQIIEYSQRNNDQKLCLGMFIVLASLDNFQVTQFNVIANQHDLVLKKYEISDFIEDLYPEQLNILCNKMLIELAGQ